MQAAVDCVRYRVDEDNGGGVVAQKEGETFQRIGNVSGVLRRKLRITCSRLVLFDEEPDRGPVPASASNAAISCDRTGSLGKGHNHADQTDEGGDCEKTENPPPFGYMDDDSSQNRT